MITKKQEKSQEYTFGEYAARFGRSLHAQLSIEEAADIRARAVKLAEEKGIKIKYKKGERMKSSSLTPLLPFQIWQEILEP